jgi:hypothetical protein
MSGTEITSPRENPVAVFDRHRQALATESALVDNSVGEWIKGKLAGIMEAGSFEEINALMTSTGLTAARDLVGRTLAILDFVVRDTGYADSVAAWQQYCIVKASDAETGEEFVIDGGGDQFIAGIVAMRNLYGFPFTGTLLALGTQSGREMQYWRFHNPGRPKIDRS